jgi:ABC-2 type transport system ATP-binding protein
MKLVIKDICKSFGEKQVLKDINFEFEQGKIYGLLGRNGAGKTTFFNCLNDDMSFDKGEYYLEDDGKKLKVEYQDIGYIIANPILPDYLTGREFLKFFIDVNKDKIKNLKTIDEYFESMKIKEEDRDRFLKNYSLGMKNQMQMTVNIMSDSKLLLLDEPLTSFDVVAAEDIKNLIRDIKKDRIIIFSTHIMDLAVSLCDEIVLLRNGSLEEIPRENLDDNQYKQKIIGIFKEDTDE